MIGHQEELCFRQPPWDCEPAPAEESDVADDQMITLLPDMMIPWAII